MNRLCEYCQGFVETIWTSSQSEIPPSGVVHPVKNIHSWINKAASLDWHQWPVSCRLCALLWGRQVCADPNWAVTLRDNGYAFIEERGDVLKIYISIEEPDGQESSGASIMAEISPLKSSAEDPTGKGQLDDTPLSSSTWSVSTLNQVHAWLRDCRLSHPACIAVCQPDGPNGHALPLRFLDVNPRDKPFNNPQTYEDLQHHSVHSDPLVRVCFTKDLPANTPYLTLSHCWGKRPAILLGHQNKQSLYEAIPQESLMAQGGTLLRDAILVTRSLGFRYIWIDTLCLNQDDDLEKLDQISKMHIFYSRAVINLSATAAEGGANGMIQDRYPFLFAPLTLSMANATSSKGGVSNDTSSSLVFFKDERGACIHDAKIYSRGWVFQERMLAQRVLHFASDQVYWECHSLDLCDTTPSEKSFGSFEQEHEKKSLSIPAAPLSSQADVPADHAWQLWQDLLGSYTKTNVTFPNDKLVALGALARRFGEAFRLAPREYVAGLWTGHLSTALCWEAQTPSHRPSSYRAPTWSWASIQTSSGYSGCRSVKDDMQVVDVSVTAKNATDPFGELVDGRLRIRGTIFKSFYVKGDSLDDIGDRRLELVRTSRSLTAPAKSGRAWLIVSWDLDTWGAREASSPQVSKSYFLLPLFRGDDGDERLQTDKEEELFIGKACLVLRQTGKKGQYVREGIILSSFWTVTDDEPRPPLRNRIEYTEEALSDEDYLKSHNDGSHTIEIV